MRYHIPLTDSPGWLWKLRTFLIGRRSRGAFFEISSRWLQTRGSDGGFTLDGLRRRRELPGKLITQIQHNFVSVPEEYNLNGGVSVNEEQKD